MATNRDFKVKNGLIVAEGITASTEIQGNQFRLSSASNRIGLPATNEVAVFTNGSERIRFDSSGNVGIGTTNPTRKLHVAGDGSTTGSEDPSILLHATGTGSSDDTIFRNLIDGTTANNYIYFGDTDDQDIGRIRYNHTSNYMQFTVNAIDNVLMITNDGDIGMGTSSPSGNLHVVGRTSDAARIYLSDADNGTGAGDALLITKSGTNAFIYNRDGGSLGLGSNDNSDYVTIQSDGKVGIGTTSPGHKLEVNGSIAATTVTTGGTQDLTLDTNGGTNSGSIKIVDGANGNIELDNNGSGQVVFKGNSTKGSGQFVLNCEVNTHGITIKGPPHSAGASYTLTLPDDDGNSNQVLKTDGSGNLSWVDQSSGGSPGGSDTQVQYNNGGSFGGIAGFTFTDTSGSEQFLFSDTSDTALVKIVQEGTGAAFQVHDAGSDTSIFQVNQVGTVAIGFNTSGGGGYGKLQVNGTNYSTAHGAEAGSAGSPSFQFVGDQNTGMFSGGTDILGFSTGGTERLAIGAAGEILIGGTAAGTSGQVLTSGGSGAAVTWEDAGGGGGSPAGSDTFIQYNNGGSFGATTLAFDDTAGSEQILLDDTSDVALMKIVQRGTGSSFEVHDQASDSTVFQVSSSGGTSIGLGAGSGAGSDLLFVQGRSSSQIWTASTDGSASAPVFTRRTDLNTGMYFVGSDNIGFTTGGTLRADISDSGLLLGGSGARVTTILDEDNMATNSATALATQQSIKAYVDANSGGGGGSDTDVNVSNLTARLPQITESVTIGDATDVTVTTSGDLTVTGDLNVSEIVDPTGTGNLKLRAGGSTINILDGGVANHINITPASGRLNLFAETIAIGEADSTITTGGAYDLTINTNTGTNSGAIKIFDGANGNITLTPNGTGNVSIGNFTFDADQSVGSGQDNYVLTYDHSDGQISLEAAAGGGGGSPAGSDTFIQYNNGGSFGATTLAYTDTSGAEQYKIDISSSETPFVIVQTGAGNSFEVHDAADPDNNRFQISNAGNVTIKALNGGGWGEALYVGGNIISSRYKAEQSSASAPAYVSAYDTNTGMLFPAADNLGFSTGGTERFRFGSSGEILIGGTAAGTSGQVLTSGGSGAAVTWEDAGGGGGGGGASLANGVNNRVVTATGASGLNGEANLIFDGSKLGIGTSSPGASLHVSKTLTGNDATTLAGAEVFKVDTVDDGSSSDGPGFQIRLESTNDHNGANYEVAIIGDGGGQRKKNIFGNYGFHEYWLAGNADGKKPIAYLKADGSTSAGATQYGVFRLLSTATAWAANNFNPSGETTALQLNAGGNSYFNGGNVGIGTASPTGVLHVTAADTSAEAFRVDITDSDSTADSTPFVVDGNGRVGIGTASPDTGAALTLNGDGTSYEGLVFQVAGSKKFTMSSDGSAFYMDSSINTGNVNMRVRDSGGNLRPVLGLEGDGFRTAIGHNGTSGSSLSPQNTLQVNVGDENGVQDKDDGILLLNSDLSIAANDMIGGIGFATRDGNIPSSVREAACAIVARAREDHTTTEKGGYMEFLYSPAGKDDDTVSSIGMTLIEGKLAVNNGGLHPLTTMTLYHSGSDFNDGLTIIRNDTSVSDGDLLGAIGFDAKDGNAPSRATEASAGIAAFAAEDHSTGDKGGDLAFFTSPIDQDDDTASVERMRITSEGKVIIGDTPNFTSQHDSISKFTIQGTDAGMLIEKHDDSASGGPTLSLYRYSASEADGDLIGQINFRGEGSTGNPSTYMAIRTEIEDTTEGTKDGSLIIRGLVNNSQTDFAEINSAGLTLNQGAYNTGNVSKDANTVSGSSLADGSSVTLFTVPATTRGFKATIFFKDTSNTEYQIEEIMGYNTGSGVDFTSFGQVFSGAAAIGSLDATDSSGTTLIKFTNGQGGAINYQATISVTHMDLS